MNGGEELNGPFAAARDVILCQIDAETYRQLGENESVIIQREEQDGPPGMIQLTEFMSAAEPKQDEIRSVQ